jgi:hypothetical protein
MLGPFLEGMKEPRARSNLVSEVESRINGLLELADAEITASLEPQLQGAINATTRRSSNQPSDAIPCRTGFGAGRYTDQRTRTLPTVRVHELPALSVFLDPTAIDVIRRNQPTSKLGDREVVIIHVDTYAHALRFERSAAAGAET